MRKNRGSEVTRKRKHHKTGPEGYITVTELRRRGWTNRQIDALVSALIESPSDSAILHDPTFSAWGRRGRVLIREDLAVEVASAAVVLH